MRVVAVSPHLDDAVFSVGGTLAALVDAGHDVTVLTAFTASVPEPQGFALACQTDKGLSAEVDYMALRRAEDVAAHAVLGTTPVHLAWREAPHRGYQSPPALFAGVRPDDDVWQDIAEDLSGWDADLWLAPQGIGRHVDHLQVVRAVTALARPTAWWRDMPYVLRNPDAVGPAPTGRADVLPLQRRQRRVAACAAYTTQLDFQFGGMDAMADLVGGFVEVLCADDAARERLCSSQGRLAAPAPDGSTGELS